MPGQQRSQAPSSVENRAPPSPFQAEAAATTVLEHSSAPALAPRARSGPVWAPGGRRGRGPAAGAGTRRAALKRLGQPGPDAFVQLTPGLGRWRLVQRRRGAVGLRSRAQRGQPSVKGIVQAPQRGVRARPLGAKLRAPRRAGASSCCTSAQRLGARLTPADLQPPRHAQSSSRRGSGGNLSSNYSPSPAQPFNPSH